MRNDECVIYLTLKSGWKQTYKRDKNGWIQITNGITRRMTAEQLLSHILPPLAAGNKGRVVVSVKRRIKR